MKHPADELRREHFRDDRADDHHRRHHGNHHGKSFLRVSVPFFGQKSCIDGDECNRSRAPSHNVVEPIRQRKRRDVSVGLAARPEGIGDVSLAHIPDHPREHYRSHEQHRGREGRVLVRRAEKAEHFGHSCESGIFFQSLPERYGQRGRYREIAVTRVPELITRLRKPCLRATAGNLTLAGHGEKRVPMLRRYSGKQSATKSNSRATERNAIVTPVDSDRARIRRDSECGEIMKQIARWMVGIIFMSGLSWVAAAAQERGKAVDAEGHQWWQHAVFYEIYPRSFADSNNDGVGDLRGIASKLDYLKDLGIDAIWISPCFPSPQVDFGYDVSDYENIDPMYGTLADFDYLASEAKKRDIHIILDFVVNHSSDKHPWFLDSKSSKTSEHRDWYIWRDGKGPGQPPNNWTSTFGGSAWKFDPTTNQYYYHFFYAEQPDLNWRNPAVEKAMFDVTRWWYKRGVAGFRLDAVDTMFEDPNLTDNPIARPGKKCVRRSLP